MGTITAGSYQPASLHGRAKYGIPFLGIALVFLALVAYQLNVSYLAAQAAAVTNAKNLSLVLESSLDSDFTSAVRTVTEMVNEIDPKAMHQEMAEQFRPKVSHWLKSQVRDIASASALRYIDANGDRLYTSTEGELPVNVADRLHFRLLRDKPASPVVFSEATQGRTTGRISMYVAKSVLDKEGTFLGIATAAIDLTSIQDQLRHIDLGREGVVALRRLDTGALVVRFPGAVEIDNLPAPDLPIRLAILKDGPNGAMESVSPVDGAQRIYGYRQIGKLPFFIAVGLARDSYLAGWRRDSALLITGALLFLAIIAGVFVLLTSAESQRTKAEAKLREVLQEQKTMLDNNLVGIMKARNREIVWANSAFERMLGYDRGELVGLAAHTGFPGEKAFLALGASAYPAMIAGDVFRTEAECVRKDGEPRWVDVSGSMLSQADAEFLWVFIDITERKQIELELQRSKHQYERLASRIPVGIYILRSKPDTTFALVYVSDRMAEMLDQSVENLLGKENSVPESIHPDDLEGFKRLNQDGIEKKQPFDWTGRIHTRGAIKWMHFASSPEPQDNGDVLWHGIVEDITMRKQMEDQVLQMAFHDTLTKLPNRRLLSDRLAQNMAATKRSGCFGAAMFLDLDNFKPLNDAHGHEVGDLLLVEVADRLKRCIREMDTVARFGGDEFVVVLSQLDRDEAESISQARIVAKKIQASLSDPYRMLVKQGENALTTIEHHCTASVGVALFGKREASQDDILKWADIAMYQAKQAGPNLIRFHDPKA